MAKIFVDPKSNLVIYIYPNDHEPAHVHVFLGRKRSWDQPCIKINLCGENGFVELVEYDSPISDRKALAAFKLVQDYQELLLEKWEALHDPQEKIERGGNQESD